MVPDCNGEKNGLGPSVYCGTDCQWYHVGDPLPDLIATLESEVKDNTFFSTKIFSIQHCGVVEGSIDATGETGTFTRKMMFFPTNVHNLGDSFKPPAREKRPDLFVWGACHGHDHFLQFAKFGLFDITTGEAITPERFSKLAYCMEDSEAYLVGDKIPCYGSTSCSDQGLSRGYSDFYPSDLDGQWIDLTRLTRGWYKYIINVNYGRVFHERSFENNINQFLLFIDPDNISDVRKNYYQVVKSANACAALPEGVATPMECQPGFLDGY
jgi:hypothetical protein